MKKIDINQTAPTVKRSKAFDVFFHVVQWTWGLSVNIMGGIAYLICTKVLGYKHQKFGYANIVYMPWEQGGLSMGEFIFMRENHPNKEWTYNTRIHEYGHTWQCLLLGPLYYPVIAIPSVIWCHAFAKYREKNNVSYYKLYCESWANSWGEKFSHMKRVEIKK